jgi:hypothetical protein
MPGPKGYIEQTTPGAGNGGGGGFSTGVYVDVAGDDITGERGDPSKPFLTLAAALAASASGDTIFVGPGSFPAAFTWLDSRALAGSGVGATVVGNLTYSPTGGTSVFFSAQDLTLGSVTIDATGKTGGSILQMRMSNLRSAAISITGRTNGQDQIIADTWDAPSVSVAFVNVVGVLGNVGTDGNFDVTVATGKTISLLGCEDDGGTLSISGSGTANVAGGAFGYFTSNSDGARRLTGVVIDQNMVINSTGSVRTAGCYIGGTVSRASGATWINEGSALSGNNIEVRSSDLILTLAYNGGTIVASADCTITLPAPHAGLRFTFKAQSGVVLTIGRGSANIDGAASNAVIGSLQSLTVISDGTDWWVI